jgi:hypothetical protein
MPNFLLRRRAHGNSDGSSTVGVFLDRMFGEPQIARISKSSIDINQIAIQNLADPATNDTIKVPFESYSDIQIIHFLAGH